MTELLCSDCNATTLFVTPECQDGHDDCPDLMCVLCGLAVTRAGLLGDEQVVLVPEATAA